MMERRVKERLVGATILVALIVLIVPELLSGPKRATVTVPPLAQGLPASTRSVSVDLTTNRATASNDGEGPGVATPGVATPGAASPGGPPPGAAAPVGAAGPGLANGTEGADSAATRATSAAHPGTPDEAASGEATWGEATAGVATPGASAAPTVTTLKAQEGPSPALESRGAPPRSTASVPAPKAAAGETAAGRHAWAVQLGSFANRSNAEKLVRQLQARGSPNAYVVSSGSGSSLRYRVRLGPLGDRAAAERTIVKLKTGGHPATIVTPAS